MLTHTKLGRVFPGLKKLKIGMCEWSVADGGEENWSQKLVHRHGGEIAFIKGGDGSSQFWVQIQR